VRLGHVLIDQTMLNERLTYLVICFKIISHCISQMQMLLTELKNEEIFNKIEEVLNSGTIAGVIEKVR
jgi:putative exporter of polyketide antibiotics